MINNEIHAKRILIFVLPRGVTKTVRHCLHCDDRDGAALIGLLA